MDFIVIHFSRDGVRNWLSILQTDTSWYLGKLAVIHQLDKMDVSCDFKNCTEKPVRGEESITKCTHSVENIIEIQ